MPDLTAPTLIAATPSNSTGAVDASANIVLTFSEAMAAGAGLITITDGATQTYLGKDGSLRTRLVGATDTRTIDIADASQVSIAGDTVTINLATDLQAGKSYSVQISKGVLLDGAGNAFTGLADTTLLKFTTATVPVPAALVEHAITMTDTGSSATDFITNSATQTIAGKYSGTLADGEVVEVSLDNGGTWQTASVANNAWRLEGTLTGSSTVLARVSNAAGGHSAVARQAYTFDTDAPTVAAITLSDADLVVGETSTVTVTFSEAVTGLDADDFTVDGGALSALATADGGKTWTATLTPTKGVSAATGHIALHLGSVADLAGNSGPAASISKAFNYSTVPDAPTASVATVSIIDSGDSSTDFITHTTAQTISGTYTGTLAADEFVQVSLDDGNTWTTASASGNQWSLATTISASNTLKARVSNGYTYSNPVSKEYVLDQAAPTATVTLADSTLGAGETTTVTITFSEAVTGFTNDDITVANGTLSAVSSTDNITWTATLTPASSVTDTSNVISVSMASVADKAGNAGAGSASSANYTVDTARPTATINIADSTLTAGESTTVTLTFSEAVTGLTAADITVANGTLSGLATSDNITWSATLTPSDSVDDSSNVITLDNTGYTDLNGNAGSGSTLSSNYTVATTRPTATISVADTALTAGETTTVTITFSETVTGFTTSDLSVENGTISALQSSDGITWTATLTPATSTDDSSNVITLANSGVTDASGNAGTGTTTSANYAVATARPTATIAVSDTALKVGDTATVTITFSETVSGLTAADFSVANGTLSAPVTSDNGKTWTATLTPASGIEDTTNVITLANTGVTDSDGNTGSGTTSSANYTVDTKAPTAALSLSSNTLGAGQTATVTITFSEAVTEFSSSDLTVTGGTLGTLSTSDNITWSATLTPATSGSGSGSVQLASASLTDTAGNSGPSAAASASFTYAPSVTIASAALLYDTGDSSNDFITKTATAQTISGTLSAALGGSEFVQVSLDEGSTWSNATVSGTGWSLSGQTLTASDTLIVRVSNGNATGAEYSQQYTLDQTAPTATITLSNAEMISGETATVTITFDEPVSNLTLADLKYSGTMTTPTSSDGGTTWTATLTPSTRGSGEVRLYASSITDTAGNTGPAADASVSYTYNAPPTATITSVSMTDTNTSGDFITSSTSQEITVTLSAALGRGQYVEVSLDNGAKWNTATLDGSSWKLSGQTISASNTLKVRATNGTDTGTVHSQPYTLDRAAPTLSSIALSQNELTTGQTATVTVVFNEAVYGLTKDDFAVSGGTLGAFTTTDQLTWTGTLTPTASGSLVLLASSVTDTAGNVGAAANSSTKAFTFTADTTGPTATLALSDNTLAKNGTATLTVTLSEAVTDTPLVSDFTVSGGTLGAFTSSDNGLTWTATLTPTDGAYGAGTVTLAANAISDPAGNAGPSSAASLPFNYDTQTLALGSSIALSSDTGVYSDDLITTTAVQTISGSYSGGEIYTVMGDKIEVSLDGGDTWNSATIDHTSHTWSISATLSGSGTIQVRLTDGTGTPGTPVSASFTLDNTAPGLLSSSLLDLSTSSDSSNGLSGGTSDNVTSDTTPTVTYSLYHTGLTVGDYVDIYDASTSTTLATHTITSSDLATYGGSVSTELSLSAGSHSLTLRTRDAAGNAGAYSESGLSLTIDTSTASMNGKTVDLRSDSDSGTSSSDDITNDNTPTVTVNVANTSNLSAGDKLQIIDSSNDDAVVGTYTLAAADFGSGGEDIAITLSTLADGAHALKLRVYDKAGNIGAASSATTITIDTTAPTLTSSTPSSSSTSNSISTSSIALVFSEDMVSNASTGFQVSDGANDVRGIVGEAISGNTLSYADSTHTFTLSLSGSLNYGSNYGVTVYNSALADKAGNSLAIDTSLLTFSTESAPAIPTPSAMSLSLAESAYASLTGTDNDHITNNHTLTISGITSAYLRYKNSSAGINDWLTLAVPLNATTYSLQLDDGVYPAGAIEFQQFDTVGHESTSTTLGDDWTIDTVKPTGYISTSTLPSFFGLGSTIGITSISGSVGGSLNVSDEFIEYTTNGGSTWTKAATTTASAWTITDIKIAQGGEIGLRSSDLAGNLGWKDEDTAYTVYIGDGYAGNHTATGSKLLYTMYGNDTIDVSGASNTIYAGYGNDAVNIASASMYNKVYGEDGSDTINVNGSHNIVDGGSGADTITVTGSSNTVQTSDGANSVTVTGSSNTITGGDDEDSISVGSTSNEVHAGGGADTITVSASGNTVYGEDGADSFTLSALGSSVYGGNGSDTFTVGVSLEGTLSGLIDGGTDGTDVLTLGVSGQTLSLSGLTSNVTHMEKINLGTSNTLTISSASIKTMSDTASIRFEGDSTDRIYYSSSLWESATWIQIAGYNKYQLIADTSITFIIDADIQLINVAS